MRFLSTVGKAPLVPFREALLEGLAPDGGLYLPERVPAFSAATLDAFRGASLADVATVIAGEFVADIPADELAALCRDAFDFEVPLVRLTDRAHVLELFHGPTLAFKDVGARFMARTMGFYLREQGETLTILVATSGDTGGAVAQAFHGVAGTHVIVLYPRGKVSPVQEAQFATLGGNVQAYAVDGTFDDCQRMVKGAFRDPALRAARRLTSANSINVGRLIPQTFYYFHAVARWAEEAPPVISTPSGNFGNLCAGLLAHRMGLPCTAFVASTNANDVVPQYLDSGRFTPRPSTATISNAMDVGDPSNFDRILHLYGGSRERIVADVRGSRHDDAATRAEIRRVFDEHGMVIDPHTAVGLLGLREQLRPDERGLVLATAHPAKFREEVEPVIGREIPLPPALAAGLARENRARPLAPEVAELKRALLAD